MKLTRDQIQERLYKNKTILNAVEASLYNRLPKLLQILQDRIEYDKNALLTFGQLQREITSIPANTKVGYHGDKFLQNYIVDVPTLKIPNCISTPQNCIFD